MNSSELLSQVSSSNEIQRYLDWHYHQGIPLVLMCDAADGQRPARIVNFGANQSKFYIFCSGIRDLCEDSSTSYAVIGSTPNGGHFMASGLMRASAGVSDCFALSFPEWIDIAQSRDTYRCRAPAGHLVHFSAIDPHLNDVVCRVRDISLGGLAVEWKHSNRNPHPEQGTVTDSAILQAGKQQVHLGRLRVMHVTADKETYTVGMNFEQNVPRAFSAVVLGVQRTQYLYRPVTA
jgi:hypothetical protein